MEGHKLLENDNRLKQNAVNKAIIQQYYGSFNNKDNDDNHDDNKGDIVDNIICDTQS